MAMLAHVPAIRLAVLPVLRGLYTSCGVTKALARKRAPITFHQLLAVTSLTAGSQLLTASHSFSQQAHSFSMSVARATSSASSTLLTSLPPA